MMKLSFRPGILTLALAAIWTSSLNSVQADVRRGILYDIWYFGRSPDPACGHSPCNGLEGWLGMEMEAEKARIREDLRYHRMHLFLHNLDHKKLLHPECNPSHECYWGIYPTCWRQFPGRQCCPMPMTDVTIYDDAPDGGPPSMGPLPPRGPEGLEQDRDMQEPELPTPGSVRPRPGAPAAPPAERDAPFYFE